LGRPRPKRRLKVTYKVGDIEVVSLYDGVWEKPHDESFIKGANVEETKAAFKAVGLTDAHVPIPFTVIAVNTSGGWILIDCGTGGGQAGGPKAGRSGTEHGRCRHRSKGREDPWLFPTSMATTFPA
jgi:hypothetical protein